MVHRLQASQSGAEAPTLVTPQYVGQIYRDTANNKIYIAKSLSQGDWEEVSAGGGSSAVGARVRAYYSAFMTQSIPSDASMQKVLFDTEQWDVNDEFTNSEFTAKEAGYYNVIGEVRLFDTSGADYTLGIGVYKNDNCTKSKNVRSHGGTSTFPCIEIVDTVYLDVGDVVDIRTTQTSGGSLYIVGIGSAVATNIIVNKI